MLTDDHRHHLERLPREQQAMYILTDRSGPLGGAAFDHDIAVCAYLVHLAYIYGRSKPVLSGKPGYEAAEIIASRVRSAASRSGGLQEWASALMGDVQVRMERLRPDDLLWWRIQSRSLDDNWPRLRQRVQLEETVQAAALLRECLTELRFGGDDEKETNNTNESAA